MFAQVCVCVCVCGTNSTTVFPNKDKWTLAFGGTYLAHAECLHSMEAVNTQKNGLCMITFFMGMPASRLCWGVGFDTSGTAHGCPTRSGRTCRAAETDTPQGCWQVLDLFDPAQDIQQFHAVLLLAGAGDDLDLALDLFRCCPQLSAGAPTHNVSCLQQ